MRYWLPLAMAVTLSTVLAPCADISSIRMGDGHLWTAQNLNVKVEPSYCYDETEKNCLQYGRLYHWESAQNACASLGTGWRLPTNEEWQRMAKHYGGVWDDSPDAGAAAYKALRAGGSSGFNVPRVGGVPSTASMHAW